VCRAIRRLEDPMVELTLTVILAYGSFVLAEKLGVSGVISTVAAGMTAGQLLAHEGAPLTSAAAVETFWEYAAFALNSIVFLLLGFEVRLAPLLAAWQPILVAYLAATLARGAVVAAVVALLRPTAHALPWSWATVIGWSGLRGALSVVLVLGLPEDFPQRSLMVDMTFGVVLLTLLVQGVTMGPLLRWLGLVNADAPAGSS
jgi:CPA1 family monovalent cation:H+ antiporter